MNVVEPILFQCRINPTAPAICVPGMRLDTVTYGDLERFINNVGRMAISLGLTPRHVVAIFIRDKIFHAAMVLGLMRLGIATVSGRNEPLPEGLSADAVIADESYPFLAGRSVIIADPIWLSGDGRPPDAKHRQRTHDDEICRIVLTSGTTGVSKAVAISHRLMTARIARYAYVKGNRFPFCSRVYCDLGLASSPGFRIMLFMLSRGGTVFFFGADAGATLEAFDRHRIEVMIASPHGLGEYLKFYEAEPSVTCGFDHIISSGNRVSKHLSERIRARMCRHLFSSYGASEVSTVASAPSQHIVDIPGAVGFLTPGVEVEIVDDADRALPAGEQGIVRIRSPYAVSGYLGTPADTAKAFRDGWFYPGDAGSLGDDGALVVTGRATAVLNVGGDKVRPETIEEVLVAHPAVEQAGVFTAPDALGLDEVWAVVVGRPGLNEDGLRDHCAERLPDGLVPVRFIQVEQLPRTARGDIERRKLAELASNL